MAVTLSDAQKQELKDGARQGVVIAVLVAAIGAAGLAGWRAWKPPAPRVAAVPAVAIASSETAPVERVAVPVEQPPEPDFQGAPVPDDVRTLVGWAVTQRDPQGAPFAVIDKRRTHVYVFDAAGRLQGHSPVLLGYAPGDDSVPGIGQRPIAEVKPAERTTPAGRFEARSGRNALNEHVVWVDYDAAVSMHRVRATDPAERRLERLASPRTDDNRISYGCINVPVAFFDETVWPTLGSRRAVVYVMPEVKALHDVFPALAGVPVLAKATPLS